MKRFHLIASLLGLALLALTATAQQAAAPYTFATRYNEAGQVTGTIAPDPDGGGLLAYKATRNTYGTSGATKGLLVQVETGELSSWQDDTKAPSAWSGFAAYLTKTISYDSYGRKSAERVIGTDGFTVESLVQWSYDDWDRVRCKAVRMNKATFPSPPSDACALGTQGADGPDRITRYTYNNLDLVLTEERAVGTSLQQTYATNTYAGRSLTSQTDAKGNRTELRYNFKWWLEKRVYPSPNSPGSVNELDYNQYAYDENGNATYERKRNTKTITNTFDANNRLIFKNLSDNTYSSDIQYNYDLRGLALSSCFGATDACTASGEGETNVFDGFGNLTSRTSRMGGYARTLSFQFDKEGNRTRITHPDSNYFTYSFDGLNRQCAIGESIAAPACTSSSAMVRITYRPSGGRLDLIRPNGTVTNINVDNALRLGSFTQNFSGTTNDMTNGFLYNPASQITRLSQSNSLYTFNQLASRTGTYLSNGLNQISSIAGSALSYDSAGNLTNDAAGMTYSFDMENRLVATGGSTASTLVYDVLGRLSRITVDGTTTHFQYDGDALVGEYVGSTLTRRYVHGDQVDEPLVQYNSASVGASFRRYLHADHQASIIAHSDSAAAVPVKNKYDPYGIPATANDGRFGYTGQTWLKEIGLNYYKARMYSPKLGRFLQTDPIGYKSDMNAYLYAANEPVNRRDPSGLDWFQIDGKWEWKKQKGSYTDASGVKHKGFNGLMVVTSTGKTNKAGAEIYDVKLYHQKQMVSQGTALSGGGGNAAIGNGNYMIRGDIRNPPPTTNNPNSSVWQGNPPQDYGIQKINPGLINGFDQRASYGPIRARLNAYPPDLAVEGSYYHGQDAAPDFGTTHGCLSYSQDTTIIEQIAAFGHVRTPVSVNTPVVEP